MRQMRRPIVAAAFAVAMTLPLALSSRERLASNDATKRTVQFTYEVKVQDIPVGARHVAIWVPVPKSDAHQRVRGLRVHAPVKYRLRREPQYGNTILYLDATAPLPREIDLQFEATVERRSFSVLFDRRAGRGSKPLRRDLQADRLVPLDGRIGELAAEVTRGAATPIDRARAIYDYVTNTLNYDRSGEGWGRGDALWACDAKRGNCTDFHSLAIALARASGIPARFVIGFPLPEEKTTGEIPGYHCWAELWVDGYEWLPIDSSEASKHPGKRESLFGGLDANRIAFTTGRDLELQPRASEPLNYFVYPYVEIDGKPFAGVDRHFSFADVER